MGHLLGLQEYLDEKYNTSIFNQAVASGKPWVPSTAGGSKPVLENRKWDMMHITGQGKKSRKSR
jgi:hypothetical protein